MDEYTPADFWLEAAVIFGLALTLTAIAIEYTGTADAVINYIEYANQGA